MKACFKCHQTKPLEAFYAHPRMADGHVNICKECVKKRAAVHWRNVIKPDPVRLLNERRRCRGRVQKTLNPEALRRGKKAWAARNPEKRRAQTLVGNAIRDGRLQRQACEVCGSVAHAHHDDYAKPLDVRWLCVTHHKEHHNRLREQMLIGVID
jgi:hypothetical protein